jgi:hypothetical protein
MARSTFGGFGGDQVSLDPVGNSGFYKAAANLPATGTFWSASTGGTQYTDLVDPGTGVALAGVSTDAHGHVIPFKGPDGIVEGWVDFGGGRFKVTAVDSGIFLPVVTLDGRYESQTHAASTYSAKSGRRVTVWDYSPVGDGSADDSTAVQNAINAAGAGGSVYLGKGTFGNGRFRCNSPITLLANQTIQGDLSSVTNTGVPTNELYFSGLTARTVTDGVLNSTTTITSATAAFVAGDVGSVVSGTGIPNGASIASVTNSTTAVLSVAATSTASGVSLTFSQVGITAAAGCTIRGLQVRGPGSATTCVGMNVGAVEATYDQAYFMSWGIGVQQTGTYYSRFNRVSWRSCGVGLKLNGCYNVGLLVPRFACLNETTTAWGTAIQADTVRPLSIYGGSIEEYGAGGGISITAGLSQVSLFGVYWESNATTSPVGIKANNLSSIGLTLYGNLVYLDGHANWINLASSTARITSKGHMFSCAVGSATTPTVYSMTTGSTRGEIGPDEWTGVVKTGVGFDGLVAGNTPGLTVVRPTGITGSDVILSGRAISQAQKTVTANYTVTLDDYTVIGNGTSITVTLPDPLSGVAKGRRFVVKNINSTSLTLVCSPGTRTIDGATSLTLTQWQMVTVETDFATGYLVVAKV